MESAEQKVKDVGVLEMQDLLHLGLNGFGLQLFIESLADKMKLFEGDLKFKFRGLQFTVQKIEGEEPDFRHH